MLENCQICGSGILSEKLAIPSLTLRQVPARIDHTQYGNEKETPGMKRILYEGEFFGQTLKSCEVAGLSLTETTHGPNIKLPRHAHSHAYFCIALQGTYTEVYEKKIRECHALTLAFHPPFELHSEQFRDLIVRSFNVEMKPCFLERIREHSPILDSPADFQGGLTAMLGIRAYNE